MVNTYIVNSIVFSTTITHILYSISKDLHFGIILMCQNNYCCTKKQPTGSQSSSMAEQRSIAQTTTELTWWTFLLRGLHISLPHVPILFFLTILSSLFMTVNPIFHARSKHIELDYHDVHKGISLRLLATQHVPTSSQMVDIFTKPQTHVDLECPYCKKLCFTTTHNYEEWYLLGCYLSMWPTNQ